MRLIDGEVSEPQIANFRTCFHGYTPPIGTYPPYLHIYPTGKRGQNTFETSPPLRKVVAEVLSIFLTKQVSRTKNETILDGLVFGTRTRTVGAVSNFLTERTE